MTTKANVKTHRVMYAKRGNDFVIGLGYVLSKAFASQVQGGEQMELSCRLMVYRFISFR